jgi:DNA repair protein RecO
VPPFGRERVGIVVARHDVGDHDRVLRLLVAEDGRVGAFLRSARKKAPAAGVGARVRVRLRPTRGELETVAAIEVEDPRLGLGRGPVPLAAAAYACELAGSLAQPGHAEPRLFGLLETALLVLDAATGDPGAAFVAAVELKALHCGGFRPVLGRCAACGGALDVAPQFSPSQGGAVHGRCADRGAVATPPEMLAALDAALHAPTATLVDASLPPGPPDLGYRLVVHHLGHALRARAVLDALW